MTLARSSGRRREFAVRQALGAGRLQLARLLLAESSILAIGGGALGLLAADSSLNVLMAIPGNPIPYGESIAVNASVLLYCAGISLLAALVSGFAPAMYVGSRSLHGAMSEGGPRQSAATPRRRSGEFWLTGQVAAALVVLVGAALMVESLRRLMDADPGFPVENALTMRVELPREQYPEPGQAAAFWAELSQRLKANPRIESAGAISRLPVRSWGTNGGFQIESQGKKPTGDVPFAEYRVVTPGYFEALGSPLIGGRFPGWHDGADSPRVVVINQTAAQRYWPGDDPIGDRITPGFGAGDSWFTIVGIVADVKNLGLYQNPRAEIYVAAAQANQRGMSWVIRTTGDPLAVAADVRNTVWSIDPDQPVYQVLTMDEIMSHAASGTRFLATLFSAFGILALVLVVIGVYGVMSYMVARRTHEIGLRLAVGAQRAQILGFVFKRGFRQVLIGLAIGSVQALMLSRILRHYVFGIAPSNPLPYAAAFVFLAAITGAACYIPARRASNVDPAVSLRYE
jgi:putative ABC transport system permease protein